VRRIKRSASQSLGKWRASIADLQPCRHDGPKVKEEGIGIFCGKCRVVLVVELGGTL
jgi:hypothetical protein